MARRATTTIFQFMMWKIILIKDVMLGLQFGNLVKLRGLD